MDPYAKAAIGFARAYQMNMRAADEQRRANQPSTSAFVDTVSEEDSNYDNAPFLQAPFTATQPYGSSGDGTILDQSNGETQARAKQKATKYLNKEM